jgi:phosphoribosyl 1,2-cyclic phosphate phosphodiesterase
MKARVTVLGSGTSHGVPMIGCTCAVCRSADPRDKRLRASIHLAVEQGPSILVDTSTDLRQQVLTHGLTHVDAILFTHSHADHVMGLDDVRRFSVMKKGPIPAFADERTAADLRRTFSYVLNPPAEPGISVPQLSISTIAGRFNLGTVGIEPIPIFHGTRPILGFRFGSLAYLTDCSRLADEAWPLLEGLDVLILDALRHRPHPTHFTVEQALAVVERLRPSQTYFTHICHDLPHEATNAALPPGVALAYDGLALTIEAAPAFAEAPAGMPAAEVKWT